jgi:GH15 family glucan-1,4-alpha-glucosidase
VRAIREVLARILCKTEISGVARYENDRYFRGVGGVPGNPWIITTLWLAQYYIACAKKESDFDEAKKWIAWTIKHSGHSGVLSEQLNPYTGEQLSATPLAWSHAEYLITIMAYLDRLEYLGICLKCNPLYQED